jgi:7,8-dihydropterin-6-yl-methyl-4-(beta-D-ribofuranosyl)aminobenzene 5'-phosphate synthase
MRITVLLENTTKDLNLKPKHGLSIYIETNTHKLLFDVGPDNTFLNNAYKLGVNLSEVDTVVLSHGHKDHGGALPSFLKINKQAKIYVHRQAFEPHYIKVLFAKIPYGLNKGIAGNDRIILTDGVMQIDDELLLFSGIQENFDTRSNRRQMKKTSNGFVQDDFAHEQNLIVTTGGSAMLFSGCAHKGIANILRTAKRHSPDIDAVFGGFHLFNPVTKHIEPPEVLHRLINDLSVHDTVYYTGHCTGTKTIERLRNSMGEKVQYLSTGTIIEI